MAFSFMDIAIDKIPNYWGMAGVFMGEFELWRAENERIAALRFIAQQGFHGTAIFAGDYAKPEILDVLCELAANEGQSHFAHSGVAYREPVAESQAALNSALDTFLAHRSDIPIRVLSLCVRNKKSRFEREFPLAKQLEVISEVLRPVVERSRAAGLPVAIENHGDYYVSDLVTLCEMVPGLEIMLDTGNCFLIGERPDLIPDAAFPLVRSTHWKDHYVSPNPKTLNFELTGATLGEGDVGLDFLYEKLCRLHPDPASVLMQIEWVPAPGTGQAILDCFDRSKKYLEKISAGKFPRK